MANWVETLNSARKTSMIQDGRRKIHYTFSDDRELVEEYDIKSNEIVIRKWRKKTTLGESTKFDYEIGEPEKFGASLALGVEHMAESSSNPVFFRQDTKKAFQWRIRNLLYPLNVYDVKVEGDTIVVRTSNKKYFKKFQIPDMQRENIPLEESDLTFAHANNTLIIQYKKPKQILDNHEVIVSELKKMKLSGDGDVDCKQS